MIYKQVNFQDFCNSFSDSYQNNFSHEGKYALYSYLEQLSEDTGENIELDPIALCCEYGEYESAIDCIHDCGYELPDTASADDTPDEAEAKALEYLRDNTQVIEIEGSTSIIIANF